MWRQQFIKNLVETNKALNVMYRKYGYYPELKFPEKLDTDKELIDFAKEIHKAISHPELAYLNKKNK
jgi:hypothetical protein